ncbi:MAG TPA: alkaline phosphatase D family protein [Blastocatellia bacterium]|nr:alkaline phosphatase D family protein [Blastocatellia bacterium]
MSDTIIFGPWSGAVTSTSAQVKAAITNNTQARLAVSTNSDMVSPQFRHPDSLSVSEMTVVSFDLTGLQPNTEYHYELEINNSPITSKRGRFRTFPPEDEPASFTFICSGDAETGSEHPVFTEIARREPLFFLHMGDMNYANVHSSQTKKYRKTYQKVLNSPSQAELYRQVPIVYTWDDHDFDTNDSNREAPGRLAARITYQECVPHYPLVEGRGDVAIYQAFTVGRVRFILTDTRSERTPSSAEDNADKTVLGKRQKQWLKNELAEGTEKYPLVVWINSIPWIGKKKQGADRWFGFTTERDEIGDFIESRAIRNLCMLSADAHMLAIDNGSNNQPPFGRGGFPVFHASPLESTRSVKGGPFSHGPFLDDEGQYGVFMVQDEGGSHIEVTWLGMNMQETVVTHSFASPR